jgi:hypothetical protein
LNFSLSNSSPAISSVPSAPSNSSSVFSTNTFPTNHAVAAQITNRTTVEQWRDALDAAQQRRPLLSASINTTFNRVPHFRRVTGRRISLRVVPSAYARWPLEIAHRDTGQSRRVAGSLPAWHNAEEDGG